MRVGIGALVTFGALLAIPFPAGVDLNYVKICVKLGLGVLIGAAIGVAVVRERAGKAVAKGHFLGIGPDGTAQRGGRGLLAVIPANGNPTPPNTEP